jgi:hypothetical protein
MFNVTDPETWPVTLTLEEVAEIYQRSADSIRHSLTPKSQRMPFRPAPFRKRPWLWRKADIVRDVIGARGDMGKRRTKAA